MRKKRDVIVGLDGEGIGRDPHRYTLLAWSDATGTRFDHVSNVRGLSTEKCLDFLLSMPANVQPFGFYLQYDWTMMLRDLPDSAIFRLFRPAWRKIPKDEGGGFTFVRWKDFDLHYLAGMMRIRRERQRQAITVWDVGRFFQCPFCIRDAQHKCDSKCAKLCEKAFTGALPTWKVGTVDDWQRIADMKAKRSKFSGKEATQIRRYCLDECRLLADVVKKLNDAHEGAGLKLRTWYGPGSTASVALKRWGIDKKRGEKAPLPVIDAISRAFFGGRFEHRTQGIIRGPIHGRDIVSAYPAQTVDLPCLEHGVWEHTEREGKVRHAECALVRFELRASRSRRRWGPLPVRLPDGAIVFPRSGASGWVWLSEYLAASVWPQVKFVEGWILRSDCGCRPFADVAKLFAERNRVGRKTGLGLTLKLCINSLYGKLAQSVGDPPFRSQAWAGMITSGTRAKLLDPLARYDESILGVATDGIYAEEEIDVPCGDELGMWEPSEYEKITLVRPGIYWTESSVRARGIGRKNLSESQKKVERALERGDKMIELPSIDQFGGALSTVYATRDGELRRAPRYGEWFKRPVRITLDPRPKRSDDYELWDLPGIESRPYKPSVLSVDAQKLKKLAELAWGNH